jgi:CheY-like chemotaxis protein
MAKILFVDDEKAIRMLYKDEFNDSGHELFFADCGEAAISKSKDNPPDIIVMDIRMPGIDGLEAMGQIVSRNNDIPVIINSAYPHHKEDFSSWLADAYLIKSIDMSELRNTIEEKLKSRS